MPNIHVNMNSSQTPIHESCELGRQSKGSPKPFSIVAKKRPPPIQIGWNDHGIAGDRQVLYRNFHDISGKIYLVEVSRTNLKVFFILFPNFEKPKTFLFEGLTEKQSMKLMADCENMFENIVNKMYVKFGKLQIEGIHGKGTRNNRSVNPFYASSVKSRVPDDQIPFEHGFNLVNRSVPRVVAQARAGSLNVDSTDNFPKIKSNTVAKHAYTGEITGTY